MEARLTAIRDRIKLLAAVDRECQVFGAQTHRHRLAEPLTADALGLLEARLAISLPDQYRAFVQTVAGSGAGPYYGLAEPAIPRDGGDPTRPFAFTDEAPFGAPIPTGGARHDGLVVIADQGCDYSSVLVVTGPCRGEVWSDFSHAEGSLIREAPSFLAWYETWTERALVEWAVRTAPRIALDGPEDPAELEAIAEVFEAVALRTRSPDHLRTLGYLHVREQRWDDAEAAFAAAADLPGSETDIVGGETTARLHLDRARLALVRDANSAAIRRAEAGLACEGVWYATGDELRAVLERAFAASGRRDDALAMLETRAAARFFSFDLHHRLARERLARNDLDRAGAALERAARMEDILGLPSEIEQRVSASFEPIIAELRAAGRRVDADALVARVEIILNAN